MLLKILLLALIVTICKVESTTTYPQYLYNTSPSNVKGQGKSQTTATAAASASSTAQSGKKQTVATTPRQTQTISSQAANGANGIVASPRLQFGAGQGNVQTIPISQLVGAGQGNVQTIPISQLTGAGQGNVQTINLSQLAGAGQGNVQTIPISQLAGAGQGNVQTINLSQLAGTGQGNVQAINLSQLASLISQQKGLTGATQGCGVNAGLSGLSGIQACQIPQVSALSAAIAPSNAGLKSSLSGPSSVITSPVSAITVPPSQCATVIDNSFSNTLLNVLQMLIAKDFIDNTVCNSIISEGFPVTAEAVSPGVNLNSIVQTGNEICGQPETIAQTTNQPGYYDWSPILNYLNQRYETVNTCNVPQAQVICANTPEVTALANCITQNGRTIDQITTQQSVPCQQQPATPVISEAQILEALAGYLGCSVDDITSGGSTPEIEFMEIPAQLVCNYGYMPTSTNVPVLSFCVQPLPPDGLNVGPQCLV